MTRCDAVAGFRLSGFGNGAHYELAFVAIPSARTDHAELLREETARGAYTPRVDPAVLAYAIVRIGEAFLYNDAIIALEPNVEQACAVVRLLLD